MSLPMSQVCLYYPEEVVAEVTKKAWASAGGQSRINGEQSMKGLENALQQLQPVVPLPRENWYNQAFQNFDSDKDGYISFEAFGQIIKQYHDHHAARNARKYNQHLQKTSVDDRQLSHRGLSNYIPYELPPPTHRLPPPIHVGVEPPGVLASGERRMLSQISQTLGTPDPTDNSRPTDTASESRNSDSVGFPFDSSCGSDHGRKQFQFLSNDDSVLTDHESWRVTLTTASSSLSSLEYLDSLSSNSRPVDSSRPIDNSRPTADSRPTDTPANLLESPVRPIRLERLLNAETTNPQPELSLSSSPRLWSHARAIHRFKQDCNLCRTHMSAHRLTSTFRTDNFTAPRFASYTGCFSSRHADTNRNASQTRGCFTDRVATFHASPLFTHAPQHSADVLWAPEDNGISGFRSDPARVDGEDSGSPTTYSPTEFKKRPRRRFNLFKRMRASDKFRNTTRGSYSTGQRRQLDSMPTRELFDGYPEWSGHESMMFHSPSRFSNFSNRRTSSLEDFVPSPESKSTPAPPLTTTGVPLMLAPMYGYIDHSTGQIYQTNQIMIPGLAGMGGNAVPMLFLNPMASPTTAPTNPAPTTHMGDMGCCRRCSAVLKEEQANELVIPRVELAAAPQRASMEHSLRSDSDYDIPSEEGENEAGSRRHRRISGLHQRPLPYPLKLHASSRFTRSRSSHLEVPSTRRRRTESQRTEDSSMGFESSFLEAEEFKVLDSPRMKKQVVRSLSRRPTRHHLGRSLAGDFEVSDLVNITRPRLRLSGINSSNR